MRSSLAALLAFALWLHPAAARAVAASVFIGATARDLHGEAVGTVEDLIVDVSDGRVLYVIVDAPERFVTLPIRALEATEAGPRLDMRDAGEIAHADDPRFRRAGRLIGLPLRHSGGGTIGTIVDIEFDPLRGRIERVAVVQDGKRASFPPGVLAHGRFPPLTRWQVEHPPAEDAGDAGFVRREPSDERRSLHEHRWPAGSGPAR